MTISGANLNSVLQQLQATAAQAKPANNATANPAAVQPPNEEQGADFADALISAIDRVDGMKKDATQLGQAYERGEAGVGINDVMVDMQKAGLAFEMGKQVRNRVVTAYKDIMNMQV